MIVGGKCQGCRARLDYVLDVVNDGMPELRPQDMGVAFGAGHLCGSCAKAAHDMFHARAKQAAARSSATATVTVEMRPPRKGERGWWVVAQTASEALSEVLAEMDDGGWIAESDYTGEPDPEGMIAITVILGGAR